ncbi:MULTISPECIES: hypothetical protein [unclassified Nonomuraea]|uniref:hypothetical protein n=1 Tax=unclassified Nonomuraea TaxID=2593643 RepID=UPI0033D48630
MKRSGVQGVGGQEAENDTVGIGDVEAGTVRAAVLHAVVEDAELFAVVRQSVQGFDVVGLKSEGVEAVQDGPAGARGALAQRNAEGAVLRHERHAAQNAFLEELRDELKIQQLPLPADAPLEISHRDFHMPDPSQAHAHSLARRNFGAGK